jgi:hypothetical protein
MPAVAQAKWGPSNNCGTYVNESDTVNEHCYALSIRTGQAKYASIAAEDNESASITDWASGGFITNEQWVSFGKSAEWLENGIIMGASRDCCTAYPFFAWKKPGEAFQKYETTGPVESGSGKYNYDMIYDEKVDGHWKFFWSGATNEPKWFAVETVSGFAKNWYSAQEAGMEASTEYAPTHAGREGVAATNKGFELTSYLPWTGASKVSDPGVCINTNRENGAAGNIEWTPGHNECKGNEP